MHAGFSNGFSLIIDDVPDFSLFILKASFEDFDSKPQAAGQDSRLNIAVIFLVSTGNPGDTRSLRLRLYN